MRPLPLFARFGAALVLALPLAARAADLPGRVVDGQGRAVAGAEVRLILWKVWRSPLDGPRSPLTARTAPDGRFDLADLPGGTGFDLRVTAEGYAPAATNGRLPATGVAPLVRVALGRGRTVTGRVVDGQGQPVAGAAVALLRTTEEGQSAFDDDLYRATTGADGRFAVAHCPLSWVELSVRAPGFLPRAVASRVVPAATPAGSGQADLGTFPLARGTDFAGRVTDATGKPLAGAILRDATPYADLIAQRQSSRPEPPVVATSGADGAFVAPGLDPKTAILLVCREGYLPALLPCAQPTAALVAAGRVSGRVLGADGAPVAGAAVSLRPVDPGSGRDLECPGQTGTNGMTGADGRFDLAPVKPGSYDLHASLAGFLDGVLPQSLHLDPGQVLPGIEVALAAGATIAGRVKTPDGQPVAGAEVETHSDRGEARAVTDRDGRYRLAGVEPGVRRVHLASDNYQDIAEEDLTVVPGDNPLDLTLARKPVRKARGRVLGKGGRPVAGAQIRSYGTNGRTLDDGSFEIPLVLYPEEITAVAEGYAETKLPLPAGQKDLSGLTVRLRPACAVAGHLHGLSGEDRRRAFVFAYRGEPTPGHPAQLDHASGYFRIEGLAPGVWTIRAQGEHRKAEARVKVAPGRAAQLDLTLPVLPWVPLRGRVEDPAGQPIAGVKLDTYNGGDRIYAESGKDGTFEIALARGPHQISVHHPDYLRTGQVEVEVKKAPPEDLALILQPGVRVHGRVLGLPGEKSIEVEALGVTAGYVSVDSSGTYRTDALAPGEWWLIASYGPRYHPERVVEVKVVVPPASADLPADLEVDLTFPVGSPK